MGSTLGRAPLVVVWLAGCALELDLPQAPVDSAPPTVVDVMPTVAIASLGSPLMIQGEHLEDALEVRLGTAVFPREAFEVTATGLMLHVTQDRLGELALDGAEQPLRVVTPGGSDTASTRVRVFSGRTSIEEIAPADVSPGNLVYLRGDGFDGEELTNNRVTLHLEGANCEGGVPVDPPTCVEASVFWATRGLVMALVPDRVPDGRVRVSYENLAFRSMEVGMTAWTESGRAMSDFYGALSEAEAPRDASGAMAAATQTELGAFAKDEVMVWSEPGALTTKYGSDRARIEGEGRLCYLLADGNLSPKLRVLLDGVPVASEAITCDALTPRVLQLDVESLPGLDGATRLSVQVTTPFHQSPTAWIEP